MKKNTEANRQAIRERKFFLLKMKSILVEKTNWTVQDLNTHHSITTQIHHLDTLLGERG